MVQSPADKVRFSRLTRGRAAAAAFGLGATLALVDVGIEQAQNDGRIPRGIGRGGGAFDSPQELGIGGEAGDVLEQRAETPAGRADVVQVLLRRFADEPAARAFQRVSLAPDGFIQPVHNVSAFDGSISSALREVNLPT